MTNIKSKIPNFMSDLRKVLTKIFQQNIIENYNLFYRTESFYQIDQDGRLGTYSENKPYFYNEFSDFYKSLDLEDLEEKYMAVFPLHSGMISTREGGRGLPFNKFLDIVIKNIYKKHIYLQDINSSIEYELEQLDEFLKSTITEFHYYTIITNVELPDEVKEFSLSKNIVVKTLSNEELREFYHPTYDSIMTIATTSIVISFDDTFVYQNRKAIVPDSYNNMDKIIHKILHSLNIEKEGLFRIVKQRNVPTGYVRNFVGLGGKFSRVQYLKRPVKLTKDNVKNWKDNFKNLSPKKYKLLYKPLSRLSDAETRDNKEDSIVDVVVGLESILLNDIGNEKERGEMRFRFSLNYASLFEKDERESKFRIIRDIYDLRSKIVHSASIGSDDIKIGDKVVNLYEANNMCIRILRELLNLILKDIHVSEFNTKGFWLKNILRF